MIFLPVLWKKNGLTMFLLLCTSFSASFAQVPAYIPYQAIARDAAGLAKSNTALQVEFRIYNTMIGTTPAYRETHSIVTNDFGYFNLRIGAGSAQSGSFSAISWQTGDVSFEVWLDLGSGLVPLGGRTGFLSVPYALYAANAGVSPTLTINSPNSISTNSAGLYSLQIATPTLSLNNNTLSISNGNSVALPGNYGAGSGIAINGTLISNTQPNQTVAVSGNNVSGSYPSYTVSTPSLTINSNTLGISGGNSVNLTFPPTTTIIPGTNVNVNGTAPNYTVSSVTPSLAVTGNANITGMYPTQTISVVPQTLSVSGNSLYLSGNGGSVTIPPSTTLSAGANISLTGSAPNYTINAITPTITGTGNATVTGLYPTQTVNVPAQVLSIAGNTLNLSGGGGSADISTVAWSTTGNNATNTTANFMGTTNAVDVAFRTNNTERIRITSTGEVGVGTQTPSAFFDVTGGNIKLGTGSDPFSIMYHGTIQKTNISLIISSTNVVSLNIPGALVGDMLLLTLNNHTAAVGNLTLCNAWVSAPGVVSFNLSSSAVLANVTATFSYIILRP